VINNKKITFFVILILTFGIVGYSYYLLIFKAVGLIIAPCIPDDEIYMSLALSQIDNIRLIMGFVIFFTMVGTVATMILCKKLFLRGNK